MQHIRVFEKKINARYSSQKNIANRKFSKKKFFFFKNRDL